MCYVYAAYALLMTGGSLGGARLTTDVCCCGWNDGGRKGRAAAVTHSRRDIRQDGHVMTASAHPPSATPARARGALDSG
jgi:hypothetical protein